LLILIGCLVGSFLRYKRFKNFKND
jgi:hypothetical protein